MKSRKILFLEFVLLGILAFFLIANVNVKAEGTEEDGSETMQIQTPAENPPPEGSYDDIDEEYTTHQSLATYHQKISHAPGMDDSREYFEDFGWYHTFDTTDKIIIWAKLTVRAYDVDVIIGDINNIYTDGMYKGMLLGSNEAWFETTFIVPYWELTDDNRLDVAVDIDATHWKTCWDWFNIFKWKWETSCLESADFEIIIDWSELTVRYWDLAPPPPATPVASAGGPYTNVLEGTQIILDASATTDGQEYRWDFNNDGTWDTSWSTSPMMTHVYYDEGTYTVRVEARNDGETDTATASVYVINVDPSLSIMPDQEKYITQDFLLYAQYTDPGIYDTITATWDFGDGTYASGIVEPIYYNGMLTGVGMIKGEHTYYNSGIFTVTLTVDDGDGGSDAITMIVTVNPKADADGPYTGYEGSPVEFDASNSLGAVQYRWDFDSDGIWDTSWSTSPTISHTWNDDWSGTVTLEVMGNDGLTDTSTTSVEILNVEPILLLSGNPQVDEGSTYSLTLDSIDPGDDTITSWEVNWGDGTIQTYGGSTLTVTHVYKDGPNSYLITAAATDEDGTFSSTLENYGFETGDFTGWTLTIPYGGSASVVTSHHSDLNNPENYNYENDQDAVTDYYPVAGNYFALLKTDGPGSYTRITRTITLLAGQTISGWAAFDNGDYIPFNDNAKVRILDDSNTIVGEPWYRNCNTYGSFWDGPWESWSWTAPTDGIYTIEFSVANDLDSIWDSFALFDMGFISQPVYLPVMVNNVAPDVDPGANLEVDENINYDYTWNFYDPGIYDTHSAVINWGDGIEESGTVIDDPGDGKILGDHTYWIPGTYTITISVEDNDGGTDTNSLLVTVLDKTPPETTIELSGVMGNDNWYISDVTVTLSATDPEDASEIFAIYYSMDDINWETYYGASVSFIIPDEGINTVYFYAEDTAYNVETKDSETFKIDKTAPETSISFTPYYYDPIEDKYYVTSDTLFTLTATDAFADDYSGVSETYYSLDGVNWITYGSSFSLEGPDGFYTIYYKSVDIAGNEESFKDQTVYLISLDINSYLTDSDFNPISYFDFIFRKDKPEGYTLVATNPGQFYYNIEVMNTWPISIDSLTITANLPPEFVFQGAKPIHVYLDGVDVTELCLIDLETCTITIANVDPGSMVYVAIHLDFGLKQEHFDFLTDFILESYRFESIASGEGILSGTYGSSAKLIGHQKKTTGICGFVTDLDGNPKAGINVYLYLGTEEVAIAVTDENGFYFFIDVEEGLMYTVLIGTPENPIMIIDVIPTKDEFIEANFYNQDI